MGNTVAALTIAWALGVITGFSMPFIIGFYNHVRELQRKRVSSEQFSMHESPTVPILPQGPPVLASLGFRTVPDRRRVGRKPQRPQPRRSVVR